MMVQVIRLGKFNHCLYRVMLQKVLIFCGNHDKNFWHLIFHDDQAWRIKTLPILQPSWCIQQWLNFPYVEVLM